MIRIVIAQLPQVLVSILTQIVDDESDMKIVNVVSNRRELMQVINPEIDVVLIGNNEETICTELCLQIFKRLPEAKIIILTPNGSSATSYWLGMHRQDVDMTSTISLTQTIEQLASYAWVSSADK